MSFEPPILVAVFKKSSIALAIALVVFGLGYFLYFVPNFGFPASEVAPTQKRWAQVVKWAERTEVARAPMGPLDAAIQITKKNRIAVEVLLDQIEAEEENPSAALSNGTIIEIIENLLEWSKDGGLGTDACSFPASEAKIVARFVLAGTDAEHAEENIAAVLRLAALLRQGRMLHTAFGFEMAEGAALWAKSMHFPPTKAFTDFEPKVEEVFYGLVRESVCVVDLADRTTGKAPIFAGFTMMREPETGGTRLVRLGRELLVLKKFKADRIHQAHQYKDDLHRLAVAAALPREVDMPSGLLANMMAGNFRQLIEDIHFTRLPTYQEYLNTTD